jgi:hypothetical protein
VDPAFEVLLCCARLELGDRDRERLRLLFTGPVDWAWLEALADHHGLRPLLFRHLGTHSCGDIPPDFETRLWLHCQQLAQRNRRMESELLAIVHLLQGEGIGVLLHKGPMLARLIYRDPALREYGDLDLLLPHARIARARELLEGCGYAPLFRLTPALDRAQLASPRHYHVALKREVMVELHWRSDAEFPVGRPDDPSWWASRPTIEFDGEKLRRLGNEELVLAMLLHGSKHLWEQLGWLAELAQFLRDRPGFEWGWILQETVRLQSRRRVALGLLLLQDWFHMDFPESVSTGISGFPGLSALAGKVAQRWNDAGQRRGWRASERLAMNLNLCDSGSQRARHALDVVFRPGFEEWSRWPLPRAFHAFYLPLRAARLLGKYMRRRRRPAP